VQCLTCGRKNQDGKRLTVANGIWLDVAMKQIKIAELKDHLSEHLRAVEGGLEMEVTDRRRPIVRLVPISPPSVTVIVPASRPFRDVRGKRYRPARWGVSSSELLREERGKR
jgi:prevent-host-death family protein